MTTTPQQQHGLSTSFVCTFSHDNDGTVVLNDASCSFLPFCFSACRVASPRSHFCSMANHTTPLITLKNPKRETPLPEGPRETRRIVKKMPSKIAALRRRVPKSKQQKSAVRPHERTSVLRPSRTKKVSSLSEGDGGFPSAVSFRVLSVSSSGSSALLEDDAEGRWAVASPFPDTLLTAKVEMRVLPIVKHMFNHDTLQWTQESSTLCVRKPCPPLAEGGMRITYEVEEVTLDGVHERHRAMVAKRFVSHRGPNWRLLVQKGHYFKESETQCVCMAFSTHFSQALRALGATAVPPVEPVQFTFLPSYVVCVEPEHIPPPPFISSEWGQLFGEVHPPMHHEPPSMEVPESPLWFSMEPMLLGNYTKYNSNYGEVYATSARRKREPWEELQQLSSSAHAARRHMLFEAAEALSHFSLADSGGTMLVCDLQGVDTLLTDPQIHTINGQGFGLGNMGREGIQKWGIQHTCNDYCAALQLPPLDRKWLMESRNAVRNCGYFLPTAAPVLARPEYRRIQRYCDEMGSIDAVNKHFPYPYAPSDDEGKTHPAPWRPSIPAAAVTITGDTEGDKMLCG